MTLLQVRTAHCVNGARAVSDWMMFSHKCWNGNTGTNSGTVVFWRMGVCRIRYGTQLDVLRGTSSFRSTVSGFFDQSLFLGFAFWRVNKA